MKRYLDKDETQLVGGCVVMNGRVKSDQVTDRINYLTENALVRLSSSEDGWDILYRDKSDGRYWELTFPQGHMHGGGPPTLTCISKEIVNSKYSN